MGEREASFGLAVNLFNKIKTLSALTDQGLFLCFRFCGPVTTVDIPTISVPDKAGETDSNEQAAKTQPKQDKSFCLIFHRF